jgi:pimeloyl-ACP methyl ester carboxylesterase
VLIHGGNAVAVQLAPLMAALQGAFHVVAPDRPGCGLTDKFDYRGVSLREHAVQFVTSVLDALDLPRATLVANSMGGYWALVFALAYPERVTKLVLVGEPAGSAPPHGPLPARPTSGQPTLDSIRSHYAERLVAHSERVSAEMLQANHAAALLPGAAQAWDTMLETIRHERLGLTYALRPELAQLRPTTLFIWGDKDTFGSPALGAEMAALAPDARCAVIHDAGHLPFWDQPEQCAQLIRAFLAGAL